MSGELIEGKGTWLERGGVEFELPDQHTAEWAERGGARCIQLSTPQMGGVYYVNGVEQDDERVLVHVGELVDAHGPPSSGERIELMEYPFPS